MERAGGGVFLEERLVRNFSHVEDLLEREGNKRMFRAHVQGISIISWEFLVKKSQRSNQ